MERKQILEYFEQYQEETQGPHNSGHRAKPEGLRLYYGDGRGWKACAKCAGAPDAKTHDFKYGANLFMLDELETPEKNERYKNVF